MGALFSKIGVKKRVGITHTAKFFKLAYKAMNIHPDKGVSATISDKSYISDLVRFTARHCSAYKFPPSMVFDKQNELMMNKYGKPNRRISYNSNEITYRTPAFSDLLNSKGVFSIEYLQAVYEAYVKLKLKHENRLQDIDELLDLG